MSHSRRKFKIGKCFCGAGLIPLLEHKYRHWAECPTLANPHEENDRFLRFLERKRNVDAFRGLDP